MIPGQSAVAGCLIFGNYVICIVNRSRTKNKAALCNEIATRTAIKSRVLEIRKECMEMNNEINREF